MASSPHNIPAPLRALNILENVSDAVYAFDRQWRFVYANGPGLAMARLPENRLLGGEFWTLFPELLGGQEEINLRAVMSEGGSRRFEYFYPPYNLWIEIDAWATPDGMAIFVRDIGHRKRGDSAKDELVAALKAEQERLRLSEERFRIALQNSPVAVFNQDANLTYTWIYNTLDHFRNIDWIGRSDLDLGESNSSLIEMKQTVLRTGKGMRREVEVTGSDGSRFLDIHMEPLRGPEGSIVGLTGATSDTTERKRALAEIERQKTQLRSVIDGMPGLVSYVDRNLTYRFVNARFRDWMGRSVEDFEGRALNEVLSPESMENARRHLEKAFAGESVWFEKRLQCADTVRDVRATYVPQRDSAGNVEGVIVLIMDITEQKKAEEARLESELQFRRIVELASEGIWMVDAGGHTTFANRRMGELLGYPPDELMGRHFSDFLDAEDLQRGMAGFARRIEGDPRPREYRFVRSDGAPLWLDFTAVPMRGNGGELTGILAMCTDITERKLEREQMQQTQKLESLGVLAGGIAHDFNNLLVGMLGNASLASDILPPTSQTQPLLQGVISAAERAAKLTRQLLAYAGRGPRKTGPVNLDALVSEILSLVHASIPRTVKLNLELAGNLPPIEADEGQLQQILMNLVINGAESITAEAGGSVTISTALREPTEAERRQCVIPLAETPERCVALSVTDTGCGMDAATVARIFDPFFTTKFAGRGLGLSAVLGIIKAHSGTMIIETAPGKGTQFVVFLRTSVQAPEPKPPDAKRPARGSGTVLVVDDEVLVREVAVQALELSGYNVISAADGTEAIEAVRNHPEIDAVVLDLAMPNLSGDRAAPEIRLIRPGIPILLSSGCGEREAKERFADIGADGFLQKPYAVWTLIRELRRATGRE
jgi:PAS domain S-box-containing protein